jgi:hypothetical protein
MKTCMNSKYLLSYGFHLKIVPNSGLDAALMTRSSKTWYYRTGMPISKMAKIGVQHVLLSLCK